MTTSLSDVPTLKQDTWPEEHSTRVPISGSPGLGQSTEICTVLRNAISDADAIEVDFSGLTNLDVSLVQLVIAAHKSASWQHKKMRLVAGSAVSLRPAFIALGLVGSDGIARNPEEIFWAEAIGTQEQAA